MAALTVAGAIADGLCRNCAVGEAGSREGGAAGDGEACEGKCGDDLAGRSHDAAFFLKGFAETPPASSKNRRLFGLAAWSRSEFTHR